MKKQTLVLSTILFMFTLSMIACNKKDQPKPDEQELITTMKLKVSDGAGFSQTFTYKVENGIGSTTAGTIQIDTVKLAPNKTYSVIAELYNEKESPVENITEEVIEEKNDHLFLYSSTPSTGAGSISFSNGNKDNNGKPFNQTITFTTGDAGSGTIKVNLMHDPTDKNGTTPATSGGETDAEVTYPVKVQ